MNFFIPRLRSPSLQTLSVSLRRRRGEGYITLAILMLPLMLLVMVFTFDGLSSIVAYRRAQGLATLGIQAASTATRFDGMRTTLADNACAMAKDLICSSSSTSASRAPHTDTTQCSDTLKVQCTASTNVLDLVVGVKPIRLLNTALGLPIDYAQARAKGGPRYGINGAE